MKQFVFILIAAFMYLSGITQNVGIGTTSPNPNAILDLSSNNKGILIPRMDSFQRKAMPPIAGMLVYDSSYRSFWYNDGLAWINLAALARPAVGGVQYWNGSQWVAIPPGLPGQFLQISASGLPEWGGHQFVVTKTVVVDNITQSTARSGDTSLSIQGSNVTSHGIVWDTFPDPKITLATKTVVNEAGNPFSGTYSSMTNLVGNHTYYVRAYATTSGNISYGNQLSFTTLPTIAAVVSTSSITNMVTIDTSSSPFTKITCGGTINTGGHIITQRGVCWSTSPNPTIALSTKTIDGSGGGVFSSQVGDLVCFTRYYIRAYATNSAGTTFYGDEVSFTTTHLGQSYFDSYVFYIDPTGLHGLMAMAYDLNFGTDAPWGCSGTSIATGTAQGTGAANTLAIVNGCATPGIAARVVYDFDPAGHNWYLPSKDEFILMIQQRQYIPSFLTFRTFLSLQTFRS